jgi:NAD(P) transhydrogenase subunit alpha
MIIGVLKEPNGEQRVALLPAEIANLTKQNIEVFVEQRAGVLAFASNEEYEKAGAKLKSRDEILSISDMVYCINKLDLSDIEKLKNNVVLFGVFSPYDSIDYIKSLQKKGITTFSMDIVPRTTRAQSMDVLSSMATVSGYKAVLTAATELPHFFPMFMTAAGTITPAKVLILGAGVAGLQAISTARRLGAVVEAFDVRSAVKEEVMSLGAKFVEVEGAIDDKSAGGYAVEQTEEFKQKQREAIHNAAIKSDVVICTAQIPGRKAPILLLNTTLKEMKKGSVVVDLAASSGGNCESTKNNETFIHEGIKIIGNSNFASTISSDASKMYGKNLMNFSKLILKDGAINLNFEDDIVVGTCVTHAGNITNERVKQLIN